ncbi:MAG: type transport system ATP-binding protein [Pseudonocardiales bacterium]|jgi:ABC-2 type transport system ATP-binding protein|nr:type transport system ATP-binding protein [Pseudonocardiales bacterium]
MITVEHISKRYGGTTAVADVSFACTPGTVTGFLGPNGAGKSTTLRILCGLARPTTGQATILGRPYRDLDQPARRVGVLLDASAQHRGRSGREVLTLAADTLGVPRERVGQLLGLVDLDGRAARRRVGEYSLGMRQRLGLAHALIGDPEILILDEPANGLDPAGIHWMRDLLGDFARRGGTVLLSSHLLHEVEVIADELVIISGGRVVAQGSAGELLAEGGISVRALDAVALVACLRSAGLRYQDRADGSFRVDGTAEDVGRAAARDGVVLLELRQPEGAGLEDLFLALTAAQSATGPNGVAA